MESFALSFASMLLALAVVIGLAWVALRLLRDRLQPRAKPGVVSTDDALRFVRALPVGAKERVVIVEHRGARWMLGVTAGGISTIAHWPAADAGKGRALDRPTPGDDAAAGRS
ncbi:MAG TPA: flagellar biosynthetic protein FliO [Burkholderiaceae bacterium]|nr:flagellar biosynthetic protein FliO [Burkholderiaceae bacterium]